MKKSITILSNNYVYHVGEKVSIYSLMVSQMLETEIEQVKLSHVIAKMDLSTAKC